MSKASVEEIKIASNGLRGSIPDVLVDADISHVEESDNVLLKFHGSYQQDDRDVRRERTKAKLDKAWSFMVRSKMPGGRISAKQWLIHHEICELSEGSLRLTNRQGIQLHGVLKGNLKAVIQGICKSGLTTMGACGDVVRNTMGPAAPIKDGIREDAQRLAEEISQRFLWRSKSYADIWLDGEKIELDWAETDVNPAVREKTTYKNGAEPEDPIYGKKWLPRKFKMGIAIPPSNDVDVFSQDVGFVPHIVDGKVEGYSIFVGGGFGMSHGQKATRPFLAQPLLYVLRKDVVDATEAIVTVQRDFGNREERKQARMKYLVQSKGIEWMREQVTERLPGIETSDAKPVSFDTVADELGWFEQGDGKSYLTLYVEMGRITDRENGPQYLSAFNEIAKELDLPFIVTPNTNMIVADVEPDQKAKVDAIFAKHNVPIGTEFTATRQVAHACVALPTCGLALGESERVLPSVMDKVDEALKELGLENDPILIRMTGCPNGCGRPYNADFGFVGRGPNKYAMYVGGSIAGDRLAGMEEKVVLLDDIPAKIRALLEPYKAERKDGETFSQWFGRSRDLGPAPDPEQFHVELAARDAQRTAAKAEVQ